MHNKFLLICLLLSLCNIPGAVMAAEPARPASPQSKQVLDLEADSVEYNYKTGTSIYRGGVVVRKGWLHLTGDVVEVTTESNQPTRIVLHGAPGTFENRLAQGGAIYVEAKKMDYDGRGQIMYMYGNVVVDYAGSIFRGNYIIYDIVKELITAPKSRERIRLTIDPERGAN